MTNTPTSPEDRERLATVYDLATRIAEIVEMAPPPLALMALAKVAGVLLAETVPAAAHERQIGNIGTAIRNQIRQHGAMTTTPPAPESVQ